ncbi:MAG TPA: ribosome maturation factor RimM, partial [Rhodothermales bacterium]
MDAAKGLVRVGRIGRPHGVRGEVKVIPETDEPERLEGLDVMYVCPAGGEPEPMQVDGLRYQHSSKGLTLLVKFAGFETPEAAMALRQRAVMVRSEDMPIEEDEVLVADLIGYEVLSESGERIGLITNVLDMPAQTVYEITRGDGSVSLLPGVAEFVRRIDSDERRMVVAPIEGLF